jgi:hypothetical protein
MNSKIPDEKVPGHFRRLRGLAKKLDPVLEKYEGKADLPLAIHDAAGENAGQVILDAIRRAN